MNRALESGPIVWFCIIAVTCFLLVVFQTMLWLVIPVLLAIISYYIMSPLVNKAMARGMTRGRAVMFVTLLLCFVLVSLGIIVGPKLTMVAQQWQQQLPAYMADGANLIVKAQDTLAHKFPFLHQSHLNPDEINKDVSEWASKQSGDVALELLHWIPSLLLVPYMTYFFLLDGPAFKRFLVQAIPNAFFEKALYLFYRVDDQIRRYFQGLMMLTLLDGLCLGIGLFFFGVKWPFFLAGLAAVMAWLPYLGSVGGGLLVLLIAVHNAPGDPWIAYEVVLLFVVVRLLDDFVFMPMTVGRSLHMHPLVTVLMILLGGAVAGVSGLLLVMPVLGVVMVAGQIIGELVNDARIRARHRHAKELRRLRAEEGL